MADTPSRKLAVIMHADVVGSTSLGHRHETLAHQRIKDAFLRLSETIEAYGGTAHEVRGDALVAEFARASDAVCAAIAFQDENKTFNALIEDDLRPQLRVGIAIGEVVIADNTITGDGVVLAQRLEQIAEPEGVCIQGAAYETLPKRLPFDYENLGEQILKGFEESVRAYGVSIKGDELVPSPEVSNSPKAASESPDQTSIAVLPFINLSGDPEQEFFADGLTEDIITALSKNADLLVISHKSTLAYKETRVTAQQLGQELGVRYILEGSVRKAVGRVRISTELIDSHTGHHVWGEKFDEYSTDVFGLQDGVVEKIVATVGGSGGEIDRLARERVIHKETDNLAAYECFLRGREYLHRYRVRDEKFVQAKEMFERAIELDPGFARGYLGLAWYLVLTVKFGRAEEPVQAIGQATELARKAVEIDRPTHWSHWILANICLWERDFERSAAHYERALQLNPNEADVLINMADSWCYMGRAEEAIDLAEKALRVNPSGPYYYQWTLAFIYYANRRYEEALATLKKMTYLGDAKRLVAATYAKLGNLEQARISAKEYLDEYPQFSIQCWAELEPYQNPADLEDYVDGMRMAGLPD